MELKVMKCPVCGGGIEIKEDSDTVVCGYCKTPLYIEEDNLVRIQSKVRIKEIEHETARYKMSLDDKEKARTAKLKGQKEENRHLILLAVLPVILLLAGFGFLYGGHGLKTRTLEKTVAEIQEDIRNENFDDARVKVESLRDSDFSSDDKKRWNQTRKELTKQINAAEKEALIAKSIPVPAASSKIKGMNYSDVVELFEEAGFTNVEAIESSDKAGFFHDANEVKEISIAGDKRFKEGDVFLPDAVISIYYYSEK